MERVKDICLLWSDGVVRLAMRAHNEVCGAPSLNHPTLHQHLQEVNLSYRSLIRS